MSSTSGIGGASGSGSGSGFGLGKRVRRRRLGVVADVRREERRRLLGLRRVRRSRLGLGLGSRLRRFFRGNPQGADQGQFREHRVRRDHTRLSGGTLDRGHPMSEDGLDTLVMRGSLESKLFGARPAELSIGRFWVLERLGEGGMGVVYMVYDEQLDRRVALKLLKGDSSTQLRQRLQREARALAQLSHPNVVPVFEVGEHEGQLFIVLEYLKGETLRQWVGAERRTADAILDKYLQAGRGLAAAHAAGIVHRDFKPDNAIVGSSGRVRVVDFGLARKDTEIVEPSPRPASDAPKSEPGHDTPLTETGSVVGTPAYMAPEQFAGSAVDHRTDQFAFCVSLWEALCDVRPFEGRTREQLAMRVAEGNPTPPPRDRPLPAGLRRALERGLLPDPDARWATMDELLDALQRHRSARGRWMRRAAIAVPVVGVAAAASWGRAEAPSVDRCVDGPALIAEVWNEDRRATVGRALRAIEVGYADATAERVDGLLAGYGEAWIAAHRDACESALITRSQSPTVMKQRMRCLDERKRRLDALIGVLEAADENVLRTAVPAASRLPEIDACADLDYVAEEVPLPEDEQAAAEVERIAADLARAEALEAAGRASEALALSEKSLEAARELDYAPLRVQASTEVAKGHFSLGKYDEAVAAAYEGFELADAGSRREVARNLGILGYAMHQKGEYAAALAYRRKALVVVERLHGGEHPDVAMVHGRIGDTLKAQGKLEEAETHMLAMLDILSRSEEQDNEINVALAHGSLGSVLELQGRTDESIEHHEIALEIRRKRLGEIHPDVAASQISIGLSLGAQQRYEDALAWYDKGLATQLKIWPSDHPEIGATHNNIAVAHENLGRLEEARAGYERAAEIWKRAFGREHPYVAIAYNNLGEVELKSGNLEQALANHEEALEIRLEVLGEDHPSVGGSHVSIGHVLSGLARPEDALEHYEEGLRIEAAAFGEEHPNLGGTHEAIGSALLALDRFEEGIEHLRRSLSIYAKADPPRPDEAWTHLALGRAVTRREGCAPALEHFDRAAAIWREHFGDAHPHLARPFAAIGQCKAASERATEAHKALAKLADANPDSPVTGALLALLDADNEAALAATRSKLTEMGEWHY